MNSKLRFNYPWQKLDDHAFRSAVREFLDNGADKFVINDPLLLQMVQNPERVDFLHRLCREMKIEFSSVHGLCSGQYDLDIPDKELRPQLFADQIKGLEIAAGFGCKTYTVHIGAAPYCFKKIPLETLRPLCLESIERMLPTAEKLGMVIAVENSFEMPNSAKEVLYYVNHFAGNPAVGVCYDTGHANCMAMTPGKEKAKYQPYFPQCWWEGIIYENNAIDALKEHIVTCHIHDNDGYGDLHAMPFDGTIEWKPLMAKLFSCPRMIDMQSEVCFDEGTNWAGELLAPAGGYSIRRLVDTFRYLGF